MELLYKCEETQDFIVQLMMNYLVNTLIILKL